MLGAWVCGPTAGVKGWHANVACRGVNVRNFVRRHGAFSVEADVYQYRCTIISWIDADTVDVDVDLGFTVWVRQRLRVQGVNAPEIHSKDADEKRRGFAALAAAVDLAPPDSLVTIRSHKPGAGDKYGRWLANVELADGKDYAAVMLATGHVKEWDGTGPKPK